MVLLKRILTGLKSRGLGVRSSCWYHGIERVMELVVRRLFLPIEQSRVEKLHLIQRVGCLPCARHLKLKPLAVNWRVLLVDGHVRLRSVALRKILQSRARERVIAICSRLPAGLLGTQSARLCLLATSS